MDQGMNMNQMYVREIISKFAEAGYSIHPKALEAFKQVHDVDTVIKDLCERVNGPVIHYEDVLKCVTNHEPSIKVLRDVSGNSCCEGEVTDFVAFFNSRYNKLARILKKRMSSIQIGSIQRMRNHRRIEIIGMVNDIRESSSGHKLLELEDPSGVVTAAVLKNSPPFREAERLLPDEVIGIRGTLSRDSLVIVEEILFPEIPMRQETRKRIDTGIIFTSDVHMGSNTFLNDVWDRFIMWINEEIGGEKHQALARSVEYMVVAGDLVDGVGVYPNQDKELAIPDVYEQYEKVAEELDRIPKRVKIIVSPGNHDAVRQAEPQPVLPKEIQSLFSNNVYFVGNPSYVDILGLKVLIYHGRSLDDIITHIPGFGYEEPQKPMVELLRKRHLGPMYGSRTLIAPENEDYLVIDDIPDVLHCGHVHTFGHTVYKGVLALNTGTWQSQTEFQKKMNLNPMPGNLAVYNPSKGLVRLRFYQ
jgi:DNA polymerase II small subunit